MQLSGLVSQTHITNVFFSCTETMSVLCFDVLTGLITINVHVSEVFIFGDVWYDPGVWLWDTAGGLTVSCLSHLPRECQTVYLTRYCLSVFSLCLTHTHTHTPHTLTKIHSQMCTLISMVETPEHLHKRAQMKVCRKHRHSLSHTHAHTLMHRVSGFK